MVLVHVNIIYGSVRGVVSGSYMVVYVVSGSDMVLYVVSGWVPEEGEGHEGRGADRKALADGGRWYMVLRYMALWCTWYMVYGAWWYMALWRIWYMVNGTW